MRVKPAGFVVSFALAGGCAQGPVWTVDEKIQRVVGGTDATSVAYKTPDGDHGVLWLEDPGQQLEDLHACRRRLVRYAAYHDGEPPKLAGNIAVAAPADAPFAVIWIDRRPQGRWANVEVPKSGQWLPLAQSFVREAMGEPQAADDLAKAKNVGWKFAASVLATNLFGEVELPPHWFLESEEWGLPPQVGDTSLVLKDHKGALQFVETSPDRLAHVGSLKYAGFEVPEVADGITRITSRRYPDRDAFIVRDGERIVVLVAGAGQDEGFLEEAAKLAEFFAAALEKVGSAP